MKSRRSPTFKDIEKALGLKFKNKKLLQKALTHSSAVPDSPEASNETLEFLGDAVLELVVREFLIEKHPGAEEGRLNQLKKRYTSEEALYRLGKTLGLGNFLILDRGEELTGGRERASNISGCLEALIGALYLDQGFSYTKEFLKKILLNKKFRLPRDYKSLLNEWAMKHKKTVKYIVTQEQGLPHDKTFFVELFIDEQSVAQGKGKSKKEAEQDAARKFMRHKE
ncbi:MAG: ribonuclease III [candidate division WOR-3 bacterium]